MIAASAVDAGDAADRGKLDQRRHEEERAVAAAAERGQHLADSDFSLAPAAPGETIQHIPDRFRFVGHIARTRGAAIRPVAAKE